ncbi:MAG TPA: MFS transporter [Stellaceae bacterium]|nr:MFS transporter [Stellaceae bacterium]
MTRRAVVAALGTTQTLAWASSYYLPAILADPMARDLQLPRSAIFGAFSAAMLLTAALGPSIGRAIDRRGGRVVLTVSNVVFASGLLLLGAAQGPIILAVAWGVLGVGMALGLYDTAFAALTRLYGLEARSAITGITLIAGFASTVGWPLSTLLNDAVGWRGACFTWAALHVLLGLPLNALLIPRGITPAPTTSRPSVMEIPPSRFAFVALSFVFAVTWFVSTAMAAHLPHLLERAGASPAAAIAAAALVGPAQVAARVVEFSLMRWLKPLRAAQVATVLHPLGAVALMAAGGPAAAIFAVLHGAGNGLLTIAKGTLPLVIFGPSGYGLRTGWLSAPARMMQAVAPFAFGLCIDAWGSGAVVISSALSLAALGALLAMRIPRTAARQAT